MERLRLKFGHMLLSREFLATVVAQSWNSPRGVFNDIHKLLEKML